MIPSTYAVPLILNSCNFIFQVELADQYGWLPLHYACANGAAEDILRILAEGYPAGKTMPEDKGRTPLHFALGYQIRPATPFTVNLLGSTGAARLPDDNGMLVSGSEVCSQEKEFVPDFPLTSITYPTTLPMPAASLCLCLRRE